MTTTHHGLTDPPMRRSIRFSGSELAVEIPRQVVA